jgi:hypothetical protein
MVKGKARMWFKVQIQPPTGNGKKGPAASRADGRPRPGGGITDSLLILAAGGHPLAAYTLLILRMTARHLFSRIILLLSLPAFSQSIEKVIFNPKDTTAGYYLAVRPRDPAIQGALVLLTSFSAPEELLTETKLHNVAYANDLLTVVVATPEKLYADAPAVERINAVLAHVAATYKVDTGRFVLAGYDYAGAVALRYTGLTREQPGRFAIRPQAVMAIDSPVDVLELWQWSRRQVARTPATPLPASTSPT